jgi:hypothetical protein
MSIITVKKCEVDLFGLVYMMNKTFKLFNQAKKGCYIDWIANSLGVNKADLTRIVIDNPQIFKLKVGAKSGKLILSGISDINVTMNTEYIVEGIRYIPRCFKEDTQEIVYEKIVKDKVSYEAKKASAFLAMIKNGKEGE